jgi:hypothetical protein
LFVSGYTPVFDTVFQGTLCGKYPDLPVWLVLLALQQRGGIIDAHPSYIATISGLPQADIELAIKRFCEPDPASRTPDHDGRRLEPLEGAGFGWRVINHRKYAEKARKLSSDAERAADGRNAARMAARKDADPRRPAQTRVDPPSDSDADNKSKRASAPASRKCPPDFEPDADFARAECPDMDVPREISKFRDWEFKTPRKDWPATWRMWVRTARDRGQYSKGSSKALPPGVKGWI